MRGATHLISTDRHSSDTSIHAPHAGCDLLSHNLRGCVDYFNSRTPCGVRLKGITKLKQIINFNPRTPCGVRPPKQLMLFALFQTSIHAPHAGCDRAILLSFRFLSHFNSRTPCGVQHTQGEIMDDTLKLQFTHPLRGATRRTKECFRQRRYFNPRTPCGVRQTNENRTLGRLQSTHLMRGATRTS